MPLEIRELNIKVNLGEGASGAGNAAQPPPAPGAGKPGEAQEQMLRDCLDQVTQLLRNRKER
jgi:hypothetical protein